MSAKQANRTPGPWGIDEETFIERTGRLNSIYIAFYDESAKRFDGRICQVFANCLVTTDDAVRANAAFIVRACNNHDDLLAVLRAVIGHGYCEQRHPAGQDLVSKDAIAQARAAIVQADGQS